LKKKEIKKNKKGESTVGKTKKKRINILWLKKNKSEKKWKKKWKKRVIHCGLLL
jgi:hypothetical protein